MGKLEVGNKCAVHCKQTGHSKNKCPVAVENNDDVYGLDLRVATNNDVNGLAWKGWCKKTRGRQLMTFLG